MRTTLLALLVLAIAYGAYRYEQNPEANSKSIRDLVSSTDPARTGTSAANSAAESTTDSSTSTSAAKAWTPPDVIPAQPHWTWKTTDGKVYHEVKIVSMDADSITILHADGGGRVPISTLSPDMQKYFNYDPAAAAETARTFDREMAQQKNAVAAEKGKTPSTAYFSETDDYSSAVEQAKADKKLILLHFTGSDWCGYCHYLDREVLATSAFQSYCASNFVVVTLDFPHGFQLAAKVKEQNASLSQKYGVQGYPTLLVTDASGRELGRRAGYEPGSGPDPLLSYFKQVCKR